MPMIRVYFKLILPISLIFPVLSLAARVLGSTQPPNPALRGFTEGCEDKPQPCWYGIVPGVTTVEQAKSLFAEQGYTVREFRDEGHDAVSMSARLLKPQAACEIQAWGKISDGIVGFILVIYCSLFISVM
jgi:hypothetical protein